MDWNLWDLSAKDALLSRLDLTNPQNRVIRGGTTGIRTIKCGRQMEPPNSTVGPQVSLDSASWPPRKLIFVGSSSADKAWASQVSDRLTGTESEGKCWTTEFPLGLLTFEALERMLRECAGAVFIVVTADSGTPNENVMIEVGLVAGRMGRTRVALCTSGDVHLPSDLAAVTHIENILETTAGTRTISRDAIHRLQEWAKALPTTLHGIPCTQVLQGYSGRWRVVLNFEKWRCTPVSDDVKELKNGQLNGRGLNIAALNADVLLHIPADGQNGSGVLVGKLTLHSQESDGKQAYTGLFHISASISQVTCGKDGGMTLRTQTIMRQPIVQAGKPPTGEALPEELAAPWIFSWKLTPSKSDPELMDILFRTGADLPHWSEGKGSAYKESVSSLW